MALNKFCMDVFALYTHFKTFSQVRTVSYFDFIRIFLMIRRIPMENPSFLMKESLISKLERKA
jgi:hypothetical protein